MGKGKHIGLGVAALAAGAGVAALAAGSHKNSSERAQKKAIEEKARAEYRNTERGKHEKNSKGIYYTNGNYEAFARPRKPEGVDEKSAYIVGSGLASLAAACFLVRDGQMEGSHIHILEAMDIAGGACDGINDPTRGYVMRGGREMENHFECLWDLFRSIPSIETPGVSVLDEYYWLNKEDPNFSLCRLRMILDKRRADKTMLITCGDRMYRIFAVSPRMIRCICPHIRCKRRLHNSIPMLSSDGRHWLPNIVRSALSTMITLDNKRLRIVEDELS